MIILWIFLSFSSCKMKSVQEDRPLNIYSNEELGQTFDTVEKNIGKPSEINTEKYGLKSFKVLEYEKNQRPFMFYTVDQNNIVIGKSVWVQPEQQAASLNWLVQNQFPKNRFKNYTPCETSGDQNFLVDQSQGIFIAYQGVKVLLISWSSTELTTIRIAQFKNKCPQLQK